MHIYSRHNVDAYFAGMMDDFLARPPQVQVPECEVKQIRDAMEKVSLLRAEKLVSVFLIAD